MGELGERRWAVISERGCEASSLRHDEAVELLHRLAAQKVHGTAVVTNRAALHLPPVQEAAGPMSASSRPVKTRSKA
ncbi:MAG TPA: hypothetical protein VGX92_00525 [Pyrinomonadaceae bacterium]|nr:hypothetical protein [Pyrinomonadaceae bacterium]